MMALDLTAPLPLEEEFSGLAARGLLTPPFRLDAMLEHASAVSARNVWLTTPRERLTYDLAIGAVTGLATRLRDLGIVAGDRIALCLANHPAFPLAAHAAWSIGAVVVALHPAYAEHLQIRQLEIVSARVVITTTDIDLLKRSLAIAAAASVPWVIAVSQSDCCAHNVVRTAPDLRVDADSRAHATTFFSSELDAPALLQFTGGTTGAPKAAVLSHRNISTNLGQLALVLDGLTRGGERGLAIAPFAHITGCNTVLNLCTYFHGELVLAMPGPPEEIARLCQTHAITYLVGPPTLLTGIAASPAAAGSWRSLRYVISGGAPLPSEVKAAFEAITGAQVLNGYGLSECSPAVSLSRASAPYTSGAVGPPVPGTAVTIVSPDDSTRELEPGEAGEICVRGPQVMTGYWRQADATAAALRNGRLHTGDVGYIDDAGNLFIVDRLKDIIIASGYNIYPANVEEQIYKHSDVLEVAVVGAPDSYRGETVVAIVALKPGASLTLEALQTFLADKLSPMEMPRRLETRETLPKSPAGKVLRRAAKDMLTADALDN